METTSPSEVYYALVGLKTGKSSGLDNILSFLLKTAAVVIAPPSPILLTFRSS